jgi:hypothetical protein
MEETTDLTIEHSMLVASEEATLGSVMAKPERMFPSNNGFNQCLCCSALPYRNKTCTKLTHVQLSKQENW